MMKWLLKTFYSILLLSTSANFAFALPQEMKEGKHIEVSMRMIGDETLKLAGDSTSRVLPIQKENASYRIQFENDFKLEPTKLIETINNVMLKTRVANSYLVEVDNCETHETVYSYEMGSSKDFDVIPCQSRNYEIGCYSLVITILDTYNPVTATLEHLSDKGELYQTAGLGESEEGFSFLFPTLLFLVAMLVLILIWKRKRGHIDDTSIIRLGKYRFDKRNMQLIYQNSKTELTSKEADLLNLLYTSANNTIEREVLLKEVWGDDGDYVGRTLDVFISKLRKKIEEDENLKIVNIRGIGYKFILND